MVDTGIEPATISFKGEKFIVVDCSFQALTGFLDVGGALGFPPKVAIVVQFSGAKPLSNKP